MTERMRRVNESVRAVVAEAVGDLKDPRIGLVTVTGVAVSPDLREAPSTSRSRQREEAARRRSRGSSRRTASCRRASPGSCRMKRTPQLTFEYDPSVERGVRMTKLIDELVPDDPLMTQRSDAD